MLFVKYKKSNDGYYNYVDSNDIVLCMLGEMLICDIRDKADSFKEWLNSEEQKNISGNCFFLEKHNESIQISDSCNSSNNPPILIPKHVLEEVLTSWSAIYKTKPSEISIIKKNSGFKFQTNH